MSVAESLRIAFLLTVALAVMHAFAPRVRRLGVIPARYTTSFGGGFAVAFVFLHQLPGLLEQRETVGEILQETIEMTPVLNLAVFVVALVGFTLILALDLWARGGTAAGGNDATVFYVQLGTFALY